jgi:hypothetical protein
LVKLVLDEAESGALRDALGAYDRLVGSELLLTEVGRAAWASLGEAGLDRAAAACELVDLRSIDRTILERARSLAPAGLRTLDAIHVATALDPPSAPILIAYDRRLLEAARFHGLETASPGA